MGDHRASIKIEMEFHGVTRKCDMWINYFPDGEWADRRVIEFFEEAYSAGMDAWNADEAKAIEEREKTETERSEREELARLKEKYG